MTDDVSPAASAAAVATRRPVAATVALWLAVVALVLTTLLIVPFIAPRNPAFVPLFILAFAGGIVGLVLGLRARRSPPTAATWALVSALIALAIDAVLVVIFATVLVFSPPTAVELRGFGPDDIDVTFSNELETRTLQWPSEGRAEFNTEGDWAEITVTAPQDAPDQTVGCQIIWNGETVVDETRENGTVTCRYDQG